MVGHWNTHKLSDSQWVSEDFVLNRGFLDMYSQLPVYIPTCVQKMPTLTYCYVTMMLGRWERRVESHWHLCSVHQRIKTCAQLVGSRQGWKISLVSNIPLPPFGSFLGMSYINTRCLSDKGMNPFPILGLPPRCPQVVWCLWGEIEPFSATLAQDGLAECDQSGKIPWNTPPWLGIEPGPRGGQTVSYPTELSWLTSQYSSSINYQKTKLNYWMNSISIIWAFFSLNSVWKDQGCVFATNDPAT